MGGTILWHEHVCTQNRLDRTTTRPTRPAATTLAIIFVVLEISDTGVSARNIADQFGIEKTQILSFLKK